jgi:isoquinoline 1-oxidoreductase subunit alpha
MSSDTITLLVNGTTRTVDAPPDMPLLWALRQPLGLVGTRFGCGMALCGACTVHVDGVPTRACVTPLSAVVGKAITTIEGVSGAVADAVQEVWVARDVAQCGYCQSGQVMAATALLGSTRAPTDADIDAAMQGNVCRCGSYPRIRQAIHDAAARLANASTGKELPPSR